MLGKLSIRLTLAMLLVSALTILSAGLMIDKAMDRQFADFMEKDQQWRNQLVIEAVKGLLDRGGDLAGREEQLSLLEAAGDVEITFAPRPGRHGMTAGGPAGRGVMHQGRRTSERVTFTDGAEALVEVAPALSREKAKREADFRQAVNTSIVAAALLSVAAVFLVSAVLSWGLTKPVQKLINSVRLVGRGELGVRAEPSGSAELKFLAKEFNLLAANLQSREKQRLKWTNNLAHELRTPLTSVQAYLEAMGDGVLEFNAENLAPVFEETRRLNDLLDNLQQLARLEMPLIDRQVVGLQDLISTELASLRILAAEKQLTLHCGDLPQIYVEGNEEMLATAVRNILVNAIKYTPPEGTITIGLTSSPGSASIEISDTGIGIKDEELPHIFERFYRTDRSRSRETGGTGIGLAVAAEIVKGHGGRIDVASEPGKGSTFTIVLPGMVG